MSDTWDIHDQIIRMNRTLNMQSELLSYVFALLSTKVKPDDASAFIDEVANSIAPSEGNEDMQPYVEKFFNDARQMLSNMKTVQ